MRKVIFLFFCLLPMALLAQTKLASSDWQDDLRYLQELVHNDYPFLFKKVTSVEFDKEVNTLYDAIPNMQDHEIMVGFSKIVALFKYGHTVLTYSGSKITHHKLPFHIHDFTNGIHITAAHKDYNAIVGAKIIAVEGKPIKEVLKAIYPVVPAENDFFFKGYGLRYLLIPEVLHAQRISETYKTDITLTLEKNGERFEKVVSANEEINHPLQYGEVKPGSDWVSSRDLENSPYYLKNLDKIYYYEYLPTTKTVYVRHSQIQDDPSESIPVFYERVFDFVEKNEVEKLVIDLRLNGGGNNYKNKPIVTGIIETEKINQTGKLFIIIGRRTFSACQNLVNELSNYTNVIFVGEPTGENINFYGDNKKVVLPNSHLTAYLSYAWWQDKPQWENGPYTIPDLKVAVDFEDYVANKDPVLQKILDFSDANYIPDPIGYLTQLFTDGKLELLRKESIRLVNDPTYEDVPFEQAFNRAGYALLDGDQVNDALMVFGMTTELFPNSAYAWYSLAEATAKANSHDKAAEFYQKAIALDPSGPTADLAKKMLKKLNGE